MNIKITRLQLFFDNMYYYTRRILKKIEGPDPRMGRIDADFDAVLALYFFLFLPAAIVVNELLNWRAYIYEIIDVALIVMLWDRAYKITPEYIKKLDRRFKKDKRGKVKEFIMLFMMILSWPLVLFICT